MTAEEERTRLIGDIARVLRDGPVPDEARSAALTLIGWLARRMPGEPVSLCDVNRCTGKPRSAPPPMSSRRPNGHAGDAIEPRSGTALRASAPRYAGGEPHTPGAPKVELRTAGPRAVAVGETPTPPAQPER